MPLSARPLGARERRTLSAGGAVIVALLAYLLWPDGDPAPEAVVIEQPPVQPAAPPAPPQAPPAPPPADASTLRLYGVMGGGAVIGGADGSQRYVPLGREVLPGLRLIRLEVRHAVLQSAGGEIRLGFDGVAQAQAAAPGRAAAPAAEAALRQQTTRYRLGLARRMREGRVAGFTVRPNADLPALAQAGIQPGDVIVSVNGSALNEEQLLELAWTIANSSRTEFEIERGGRRMRLAVPSR